MPPKTGCRTGKMLARFLPYYKVLKFKPCKRKILFVFPAFLNALQSLLQRQVVATPLLFWRPEASDVE